MIEDYEKAKRRGERTIRQARSEGRDPYLPVLDEIVPGTDTLSKKDLGVQEIPLRMVTGTKTSGRADAFSRDFMPLLKSHSELAAKWSRLYDAQIEEGINEPIRVFEYMLHFYVLEGHKRVSVLKYLDVPSIAADVTRIMPQEKDSPEYALYQEFLDFYSCVPIYDIVFTKEGSYRRFAKLVGRDLKEKWDSDFINTVRGAFFRFYRVFCNKGGETLPLTAGDAFLLYLEIYGFDSLLDRSRYDLANRIDIIWKEVLLETRNESLSLMEKPLQDDRHGVFHRLAIFNENRPLRILMIHGRDPLQDEWEAEHENGRIYLQARYGKQITASAMIVLPDEKGHYALPESYESYDVIFTTRADMLNDTLRASLSNPLKRFFNCSLYQKRQAVTGYYGRMYEAMFLMGRLAARLAKNHQIGYVADVPVYGRLSEINAFALGAELVDPEAEIHLAWSGVKDQHWKQNFLDAGVSVICGPKDEGAADNLPVHALRSMSDAEDVIYARPIWNWNLYYEQIIRMIREGSWDTKAVRNAGALNCWWGMDAGVVDLAVSSSVDWRARKDIEIFTTLMKENSYHPFSYEMHTQSGEVLNDGAKALSAHDVISMRELNHNIVGAIPSYDDLKGEVRNRNLLRSVYKGENR